MMASMMHSHTLDMDKPKTSKHMMERKRRARINDSLLQLKSLIFPAIRKEMSRQPKMEKADILEMAVRYLKELQASGHTGCTPPAAQVSQYHAGFSECLGEASNFLANCDAIDLDTRLRIMNHLADRCSNLLEPGMSATTPTASHSQQKPRLAYNRPTPPPQLNTAAPAMTSPAPSPVVMATSCSSNTRVPPVPYIIQQRQHQPQQLLLCIPKDFASRPTTSDLSQSSTRSSAIFPTPPPSPVELPTKTARQQTTHSLPSEYKTKAKSSLASSYRRHHAVIGNQATQQRNVWRPW